MVKYEYMTEEEKGRYGAVVDYKINGPELDKFKREIIRRMEKNNYTPDTLPADVAFKYATDEEKKNI